MATESASAATINLAYSCSCIFITGEVLSHGPLEFVVADAMDFGGHFVHYTVMHVHNYAVQDNFEVASSVCLSVLIISGWSERYEV